MIAFELSMHTISLYFLFTPAAATMPIFAAAACYALSPPCYHCLRCCPPFDAAADTLTIAAFEADYAFSRDDGADTAADTP